MASYDIVAGTTADLGFQLLDAGSPINLLNVTVTLLLHDRTGAAVASPGTVTVTDVTEGKVSLTPTGATVFNAAKGPYQARWRLTAASGKVSYVPSSNRDVWNIVGL
jgi:hypothetical protein